MTKRVVDIIKSLNSGSKDYDVSALSDEKSLCIVHDFLSTGCYVLDTIMGGGLPLGRIVEIYGDPSTGKSLIASQCCASVQEAGGLAIYIDTESAVSLPIMKGVGVNTDELIYTSLDTVEEVFAVMEGAIAAYYEDGDQDEPLLIVWDTIASTSSKAEMEKDTGQIGYTTQARIISQALRKMSRVIAKKRVICLFLNQVRTNIGVVFGDKVATFGGKAVAFHSSVRVHLMGTSKIRQGSKKDARVIGVSARARVVKNKIAPPFREAHLPIYFGHGIHDAQASFEFLKAAGEFKVSGQSYTLEIESGEIKSTRKKWNDVYDKHYDEICDVIDEIASSTDLL
jgi:recombination protein RecA